MYISIIKFNKLMNVYNEEKLEIYIYIYVKI